MLLKSKLQFPTYWLPLAVVAFTPHSAFSAGPGTAAVNTESSQRNALVLETDIEPMQLPEIPLVTSQAAPAATPAAPVAQAAPATVASVQQQSTTEPPAASTPAQEFPGILSAQQAEDAFSGQLQIVVVPAKGSQSHATAYLEGAIPQQCAGDMEVRTSASNSQMMSNNGPVVTEGFAIHDDGNFLSCMKQYDCSNESLHCGSLSDNERPLVIDGSQHVHLAYFAYNGLKGKLAQGAWSPSDITGSTPDIKSTAEIQNIEDQKRAAAEASREHMMLQNVETCAKTDPNLARSMIGDLNPEDQTTALGILASDIKSDNAKKVKDALAKITALTNKANSAKTKVDDLDDLEESVYDINDQLVSLHDQNLFDSNDSKNDKDFQNAEDRLAGIIEKLVDLRLSDDNANQDSIEAARATLSRALGDGDDSDSDSHHGKHDKDDDASESDGLQMSDKVASAMQTRLDYDLDRAEYSAAYTACEEDQLPGSKTTSKATRDCKNAEKLATADEKSLEKKYKDAGCEDKNGNPSSKRDNNSDLDATCSKIEEEAQAFNEVPQTDAPVVAQAYANIIKQAQQARGQVPGQTNTSALFGQGQLPQMAGTPSLPNFNTVGYPVTGAPGSSMMGSMMYPGSISGIYNPMGSTLPMTNTGVYNSYLMRGI